MRKRKFARTQLLFMGCRWCTLFLIIIQLVVTLEFPVGSIMAYIFAYLSLLFASSLIILRM
ncbi:hypothetical protein BJV74DRAFT_822664 [Russula compacta]|nr:hypothetical protein BJV74DRAFT_822664 [Russula compacta]